MKERPLKGGYILISLGLIPLSTSYSGSIDYARISKTKKRVVLTGLKVGSEIKPDVVVQPIYGSGKITFSDVYGFDIEVASTGVVTVIQHVVPILGTKLYLHNLTFSSAMLYIISPISTKVTNFSTLYELIESNRYKLVRIIDRVNNNNEVISYSQTGQHQFTFKSIKESDNTLYSTVIDMDSETVGDAVQGL